MAYIVGVLLAAGGAIAALLIERDDLNFPVISGLFAVLLTVGAVFVLAWVCRRR